MDEKRFDQLARLLGGVGGRREALKALMGGSLAGALGVFGLSDAEAKKGKGKDKKRGDKGRGKGDERKGNTGKDKGKEKKGRNSGRGRVKRQLNTRAAAPCASGNLGATCSGDGDCCTTGNLRCHQGTCQCNPPLNRTCPGNQVCGRQENANCSSQGADPSCCPGEVCGYKNNGNATRCCSGAGCATCANCADGCCDGGTCVPFAQQGNGQCGTGGKACEPCGTSQACNKQTGVCEGVTPTCPADKPHRCNGEGPCVACCGNNDCANGQVCTDQACVCPADKPHRCNGTGPCVACCGTGQAECPNGQRCENSTCVPDEQCVAVDKPCNGSHPCCHPDQYRCSITTPTGEGECVPRQNQCSSPSDCGQAPTCRVNTCEGGRCGQRNAPVNTPCTTGTQGVVGTPGGPGFCNANGECVSSQCGSGQKFCENRCIDTSQCCTGDRIGCTSGQCVNGTCIGGTCGGTCSGSFPTCGNTPGCACNASNQCVSTGSVCGGSCSSIGASCGSGCVCNGFVCVPSGGGGGGGGGGIFCDPRFCLRILPGTSTCTSDCGAGQTCQAGASTGLAGTCVSTGGAACSATNCDATQCLECANNNTLCRYKCSGNTTCSGGQCVAFPAAPGCRAGTSNLQCCRQSVKQGCRKGGGGQKGHGQGGGSCRRKGYRRCQQNFGTS